MKKVSPNERELMQRVAAAGGSHCFRADDNIPGAGHKALRSLEYRGYLTVTPTDDGPLVALTAQGRAEVDHG
jgi:hypothetical protein